MKFHFNKRLKGKNFQFRAIFFYLALLWFLILCIYHLHVFANLRHSHSHNHKIKLVEPEFHSQNKNIPEEFQLEKELWRPKKVDSEIPYDFDAGFDDRILRQREWIQNITRSGIFKNLKPKRILVEDVFPVLYKNGKLNCFNGMKEWESKCLLELEHNSSKADFYPENINDFDAVIEFRLWIPRRERKLPKGSSVKQIIFTYESPIFTRKVDLSLNNAFLATYWRGADIPVPYGKWIPHNKSSQGVQIQKSNSKKNPARPTDPGTKNYADGKSKLAAIVVSDCNPNNARLEYVKEMQRHIPVDIYGKCGTLKCAHKGNCFKDLGKIYKFYLAFENANCRDYITEKLFSNAFQTNMIPVVLGAHKKDYESAAPPNSFIHVEDFESPGKLAEYLKTIDENDDLYNSFFEWKSHGKIQYEFHLDFFCRTCALLFIADYVNPPVWPQGSTWERENVCLPKGRWYWDRPNND